MANKRWLGRAGAVAQVDTITVALTWAQNDTIKLTINGKMVTVTVGTLTTTAQVATTIKQAWENETLADTSASVSPSDGGQEFTEHAEITATVSGSVVTLTHDTAGTPFTLVVTEATAGDGTATEATDTQATGPNHYDNVDNWDPSGVPVSTDDVFIDNSDVSILYGLGQSAVTLTSLTIDRNYTGDIGLPKQNAAGYVEYRADYLAIGATTITIGRGEGTGSGRIKLDTGSVQTAINIEGMGGAAEGSALEAFLWKGTNASNTLEVHEGTVGVARFGGETATIATLKAAGGEIFLGSGTTLTTVDNESGVIEIYSNTTTITNSSGTITIGGSATVGTLNHEGGTVNYLSSGTITTCNLGGPINATLDFSGDNSARTITTLNLKPSFTIEDPFKTVTYTTINIGAGQDVRSWSGA